MADVETRPLRTVSTNSEQPTRSSCVLRLVLVMFILSVLGGIIYVIVRQTQQHERPYSKKCHFLAPCNADNAAYIQWLVERSVLNAVNVQNHQYVHGQGFQWQHRYAMPDPEAMVNANPVWFDGYPEATVTHRTDSILKTWGSENFTAGLATIGFTSFHTNPMLSAGGIVHDTTKSLGSVDGGYDPSSLDIDAKYGSASEFGTLTAMAKKQGISMYADIIPGHEGLGADFRLALYNYGEYPGIFSMVSIKPEDWHLLPTVNRNSVEESAVLDQKTVNILTEKRYLPGQLQRVIFEEYPSSYSATTIIKGVDGVNRRWVYLHYFKPGQPTINWLDPSMTGPKLKFGEIVRFLRVLNASGLRIDAVPFTGLEPPGHLAEPNASRAWSEGHPLSFIATNQVAMMTRKLGGHTFAELAMSMDKIAQYIPYGADMYYDFFTRTGITHAMIDGNPALLELSFALMKQHDLRPNVMIHGLQSHDAINYELNHFQAHPEEYFMYDGVNMSGASIRSHVLSEMYAFVDKYPTYLRKTDAYCHATYAAWVAACNRDPTAKGKARIQRGVQLIALFTAMMPGAFMISGWDLVGAMPLTDKQAQRSPRWNDIRGGDFRWYFRVGYDLLGWNPNATRSASGLPVGGALFGSVRSQLSDERKNGLTFVSWLQRMLKVRHKLGIHLSTQVLVERQGSLFMMVHMLNPAKTSDPFLAGTFLQLTYVNFHPTNVEMAEVSMAALLQSHPELEAGYYKNCANWIAMDFIAGDWSADRYIGVGDCRATFQIRMDPWQGRVVVFKANSQTGKVQ